MANYNKSPAFNPPSYPLEPDSQIDTIGQWKHLEIGARESALPKDIKNPFPVQHLPNGK